MWKSARGRAGRGFSSQKPTNMVARRPQIKQGQLSHIVLQTAWAISAPADEWIRIRAKTVIYTGRPDLIPLPRDTGRTVAGSIGLVNRFC